MIPFYRYLESTPFLPFGGYRNTPTQTVTDRGFTGHLHNDEVGLIYMNARFYVPNIGRFASADTILKMIMCQSYDPGDPNHHYTTNTNSITFDNSIGYTITLVEILLEIGHAVDWNTDGGDWWSNNAFIGHGWKTGLGITYHDPSYTEYPNKGSFDASIQEDFADTFAAYILSGTPTYPDPNKTGFKPLSPDRRNVLDVILQP